METHEHGPSLHKDALKGIFRDIHAGVDAPTLQRKFKRELGSVSPEEIGRAEQELVEEGLPREELKRLCDVHLAVMAEGLTGSEIPVEPGHPLHTLKEEHRMILEFLDQLEKSVNRIKENPTREEISRTLPAIQSASDHLMEIEKHNLREENVLFPYLEKHGITEPPAVMWSEHDDLRAMKKRLAKIINSHDHTDPKTFAKDLEKVTDEIVRTLSGHIFKENNILYPMAHQSLTGEEWQAVREGCDELGYCCFTPESAHSASNKHASKTAEVHGSPATQTEDPDRIAFPTGYLNKRQLEWMLNTLPMEITFVDKDDVFQYFSGTEDRVFARARASIGRKVQNCHPSKSLHLVNDILDDFKAGRKHKEQFWIHLGEKFLHICYFAVRDGQGEYLGTLETIQDIGPIQEISGTKRLP